MKLDDMKPEAIDAMEALFNLCDAINSGLTLGDLVDVIATSVESGHAMMAIDLAMVQIALTRAEKLHQVTE